MDIVGADAIAALSLLGVAALIWVGGTLIWPGAAAAERCAVGIAALVGVAWVAMLLGSLGYPAVSTGWPAAAAIVLAAVAAIIRRPSLRSPVDVPVLAAASVCALAVSFPSWWAPSAAPIGDMYLHRGWIEQLVGGRDTPTNVYAHVPNAYPWLYHALAGTLDGVLPVGVDGSLILMQALMVASLALGVWLLSRQLGLERAAAGWAVVLALAGGGFGLFATPAPIASLGNVAPALPRELGLALTPIQLWLVLRVGSNGPRGAAAAGAVGGMIFLIAPLAGLVALAQTVALLTRRRPSLLLPAMAAALLVSAVWIVPLASDYAHLGGFRPITAPPIEEPSAVRLVLSLGLVAPLAAAGAAMLRTRRTVDGVSVAVMAAVPALALLLAAAGATRGTGIPAFERPVRYMPLLMLALTPLAGIAAAAVGRRHLAAAALLIAAVALPVRASILTGLDASARPRLSGGCLASLGITSYSLVAVGGRGTHLLPGRAIFAGTGANALYLSRPRIRFADLDESVPSQARRLAWQRTLDDGGWPPTATAVVESPAATAPTGSVLAGSCTVAGVRLRVFMPGRAD